MQKKWTLLGAAAVIGIVGLLLYFGMRMGGLPMPSGKSMPVAKSVFYRFTLHNPSNQPIQDAQFWAMGPVRRTGNQVCKKVDASQPFTLATDHLGNQILHFKNLAFAPFQNRTITVRAYLQMTSQAVAAGKPDASYLAAAPFVEVDHPRIIKTARAFKKKEPYEVASAIHNWVSGHIKYMGYLKQERGALYALIHRQGDCTEYMDLFAALCRARQIPVRRLVGYHQKSGAQLKPGSLHNWCEFYHEGVWHLADPQKNIYDSQYTEYVALKIIDDISIQSGAGSEPRINRFKVTPGVLNVRMEG